MYLTRTYIRLLFATADTPRSVVPLRRAWVTFYNNGTSTARKKFKRGRGRVVASRPASSRVTVHCSHRCNLSPSPRSSPHHYVYSLFRYTDGNRFSLSASAIFTNLPCCDSRSSGPRAIRSRLPPFPSGCFRRYLRLSRVATAVRGCRVVVHSTYRLPPSRNPIAYHTYRAGYLSAAAAIRRCPFVRPTVAD